MKKVSLKLHNFGRLSQNLQISEPSLKTVNDNFIIHIKTWFPFLQWCWYCCHEKKRGGGGREEENFKKSQAASHWQLSYQCYEAKDVQNISSPIVCTAFFPAEISRQCLFFSWLLVGGKDL